MITILKLREALKIKPGSDIDLRQLRDDVVTLWEEHTLGLWDARTDHVQTFHPRHRCRKLLHLELAPTTSITLVQERQLAEGWDLQDVEATGYLQTGKRDLRRIDGAYWKELVVVTYTGGYATAPEDVQQALILQAQFMLARNSPDRVASKQVMIDGGGSTTYLDPSLHPHFAKLAKKKRRKGV